MKDIFVELEPPTSEAAGLYDLHQRITRTRRKAWFSLAPVLAATAIALLIWFWPGASALPTHPSLSNEWPTLSVNAGSGYLAPVEAELGGYRIVYVQ